MATAAADGRSLFYSGGMHLALLLFAIFGLPDLFDYDPEPEPIVVTLEPLPIARISNVKPVDAPIVKPKPKPPTPAKVVKSTPPVEQKKPEPKENPVKVPVKDKAPPEKEKEKPKEKPQNKDELDSILKSVREQAQQQENKDAKPKPVENVQQPGAKSEKYDPTIPMSLSEMDAIKNQIARCWSFDAGMKDSASLVVTVNAKLSPDGTILEAQLSPQSYAKAASDGYYNAAARAALVALKMPECQRLEGLPNDKYGTWKEMELVFDPRFLQ